MSHLVAAFEKQPTIQGRSLFSTDGGQYPPREFTGTRPPCVIRADPQKDRIDLIRHLRSKWPHVCFAIVPGWDIRDFWDEYDFHTQGGKFLFDTIATIVHENGQYLKHFCIDWSQNHYANFHKIAVLDIDKAFHPDDHAKYGPHFLSQALLYMRDAYTRAAEAERRINSRPRGPQYFLNKTDPASTLPYPGRERPPSTRLIQSDPTHTEREQPRCSESELTLSSTQPQMGTAFMPQQFYHFGMAPTAPGSTPYPSLGVPPLQPPPGYGMEQNLHYAFPIGGNFNGQSGQSSQSPEFAHQYPSSRPPIESQARRNSETFQENMRLTSRQDSTRRSSFSQGKHRRGSGSRRPSLSYLTEESNKTRLGTTWNSRGTGESLRSRGRRSTLDRSAHQQQPLPAATECPEYDPSKSKTESQNQSMPVVTQEQRQGIEPVEGIAFSDTERHDQANVAKVTVDNKERQQPSTITQEKTSKFPDPTLMPSSCEHGERMLVTEDRIGEGVTHIRDLFVKNTLDSSDKDLLAAFNQIAPVETISHPTSAKKKLPLTFLNFRNTSDVRKVLKAGGAKSPLSGKHFFVSVPFRYFDHHHREEFPRERRRYTDSVERPIHAKANFTPASIHIQSQTSDTTVKREEQRHIAQKSRQGLYTAQDVRSGITPGDDHSSMSPSSPTHLKVTSPPTAPGDSKIASKVTASQTSSKTVGDQKQRVCLGEAGQCRPSAELRDSMSHVSPQSQSLAKKNPIRQGDVSPSSTARTCRKESRDDQAQNLASSSSELEKRDDSLRTEPDQSYSDGMGASLPPTSDQPVVYDPTPTPTPPSQASEDQSATTAVSSKPKITLSEYNTFKHPQALPTKTLPAADPRSNSPVASSHDVSAEKKQTYAIDVSSNDLANEGTLNSKPQPPEEQPPQKKSKESPLSQTDTAGKAELQKQSAHRGSSKITKKKVPLPIVPALPRGIPAGPKSKSTPTPTCRVTPEIPSKFPSDDKAAESELQKVPSPKQKDSKDSDISPQESASTAAMEPRSRTRHGGYQLLNPNVESEAASEHESKSENPLVKENDKGSHENAKSQVNVASASAKAVSSIEPVSDQIKWRNRHQALTKLIEDLPDHHPSKEAWSGEARKFAGDLDDRQSRIKQDEDAKQDGDLTKSQRKKKSARIRDEMQQFKSRVEDLEMFYSRVHSSPTFIAKPLPKPETASPPDVQQPSEPARPQFQWRPTRPMGISEYYQQKKPYRLALDKIASLPMDPGSVRSREQFLSIDETLKPPVSSAEVQTSRSTEPVVQRRVDNRWESLQTSEPFLIYFTNENISAPQNRESGDPIIATEFDAKDQTSAAEEVQKLRKTEHPSDVESERQSKKPESKTPEIQTGKLHTDSEATTCTTDEVRAIPRSLISEEESLKMAREHDPTYEVQEEAVSDTETTMGTSPPYHCGREDPDEVKYPVKPKPRRDTHEDNSAGSSLTERMPTPEGPTIDDTKDHQFDTEATPKPTNTENLRPPASPTSSTTSATAKSYATAAGGGQSPQLAPVPLNPPTAPAKSKGRVGEGLGKDLGDPGKDLQPAVATDKSAQKMSSSPQRQRSKSHGEHASGLSIPGAHSQAATERRSSHGAKGDRKESRGPSVDWKVPPGEKLWGSKGRKGG